MDIPVFNNTKTALWVGGQMVPPGETRLLPAHHVPAHLHPAAPSAPPPPPPADPLTELLEGNVKEVVAALPGLDAGQLMNLKGLEALREAPRKGVMDAVAAALLQRAAEDEQRRQAKAQDDPLAGLLAGSVEEVLAALPDLDADQLMELEGMEGLREAPRKGVLEAVGAALLQRAAEAPAIPDAGDGG